MGKTISKAITGGTKPTASAEATATATSSTTEITLHQEPIHPALAFLLEEWKKFEQWAMKNVVEPGMAKAKELIDQAKIQLEPKYLELKAKWDPIYEEKVKPVVDKSKEYLDEAKVKSVECYKTMEPTLKELSEKSKPYVDAAAEKCCALTETAKGHLGEHTKIVKQQSIVWLKDRQADGQKWASAQQTAIAKAMGLQAKLTQQVWEGAVAGAQHAHKSANELKSVREKESKAQEMKATHLKHENYVAAGIALDAQNKLHDLGDRAEAAILAKVDALNREDYAAAAVHRKALDDIKVEAETALSSIPELEYVTGPVKADDSGLAASIASTAVANALDIDASKAAVN